jgi:peptide/nickel transport system ATP-binding protein
VAGRPVLRDGLPPGRLRCLTCSPPLVSLRGLHVSFNGQPALRGIDLDVHAGEALGLVGESGCGKSVTWLAALGLLPASARISGRATLGGKDILAAPAATLDRIRGGRIAMIFQDPASVLNPVQRVGRQVSEALRLHRGMDASAARAEARRLFDQVGIPDSASSIDA